MPRAAAVTAPFPLASASTTAAVQVVGMLSFPFPSRHLRLALPLRPLHHSRSLPARCSLSCRRYRCCAVVQVVLKCSKKKKKGI
jgi:hypothetical protein